MAVLEKMITDTGPELQPGLRLVLKAPRNVIDEDQFLRLCSENADLRLERAATGEIIIMSPTGGESGRKNSEITVQLGVWSKKDGTGVAFNALAGFTLPNGAVLSPDASWIKRERWDALSREDKERFSPICPDFVIELRSRTDRISVIRAKMREYIENGARLGWLIDPQTKQIEVYKPGQTVKTLKEPATVSGEDVLPGFVLDLAPIWE